ncbi:competence protein ComG, partial [Bacillus vallismortis]|nr:competence protein ComG [Bacillus vallismortis]
EGYENQDAVCPNGKHIIIPGGEVKVDH